MAVGLTVFEKTHTNSLKSKLSVVFTLYEALEHIAATLRLSWNLVGTKITELKEKSASFQDHV